MSKVSLLPSGINTDGMLLALEKARDGVKAGEYLSVTILCETSRGLDQLRSGCLDRYKLIGLLNQTAFDMMMDIRQEGGEPFPLKK